MAIRVRHEVPLAVSGQFAQQTGTNQGIGAAAAAEQARAEFLLGLDLKNRAFEQDANQFAVNTALRVNEQDQQQQRWRTQLAVTDATQQRQAEQRAYEQQFQWESARAAEDFDFLQQQSQDAAAWAVEQSKTLDQQASERFASLRKLKLSPEGQRILGEYSGKYRQIQSDPTLRPGAKQQALGMLMADIESAEIESYENVEPSIDEKWEQGTRTAADGSVWALDRNGTWAKRQDAPPPPAGFVPVPDSKHRIYHNGTGGTVLVPPDKPEEKEKPEPVMSQRDKVATRKGVVDELLAEYNAGLVEKMEDVTVKGSDGKEVKKKEGTGEFHYPGYTSFVEYKNKHLEERIADWNRGFGDPDEATLVPSELQPQGSTLGANIDAPLSIDMGGSPTDFGETNPGMGGGDEPIQVTSRAEAEAVEIGKTFIKDGVLWLKTGPGQAEPVGNGVP
jgi:hypothetical protein